MLFRGVGNPDRRHTIRGESHDPPRRPLVNLILASYQEMPGLMLHLNQAARLFGVRLQTCKIVMEDLVRDGRLRRVSDGQYVMP
jgi:hypothetical protein